MLPAAGQLSDSRVIVLVAERFGQGALPAITTADVQFRRMLLPLAGGLRSAECEAISETVIACFAASTYYVVCHGLGQAKP